MALKMALKVEKMTVLKVSYNDLESFIFKVYGAEYEILPGEECSSGRHKRYLVEKEVLDEYDFERLNNWRMGEDIPDFLLHTILTDLCNNDKIEAGEYIVCVSW